MARHKYLPIFTALPMALTLSMTTYGRAATGNGAPFVIAIGADNTGLDPETVMNNESGFVMAAIYDNLVEYKSGSTEVGPGLADKWEVSKDGKTYTFHLHRGILFHDGTPCDAGAIVAWLDRLLNKGNPNFYANKAGVDSYVDFTFHGVDSYKKTDDQTVVIHMDKPNAEFLNSLAMVWSGVTSPAAVAKYGAEYYKHPVGTGPFKFVEWVPNDHVTLEANTTFWKGKPKLGKLIYRIIPESAVRVMELTKGTVDVLADVSPADSAILASNKNVHVIVEPGLMVNGLALPTQTKPFNDPLVRQALNYAVDKDTLNKYLFKGLATTMNSPLPPSQWGYDKTLPGYPYNPEKAKQLLAKAGYPNGFNATIYVYPNPRGYNPIGGATLGQALQADLKKVGVNITLQQLEWGAYLAKVRSKDFSDMCLAGWSGDNGDPDNFVGALWETSQIPSGNLSHYSNKDFDALVAQGVSISDFKARLGLYAKAQRLLMKDAPWVFINYASTIRAHTTKVHGLVLNPTTMFFDMDKVSKD
jgi:peptide/nickel transport system substrate-binding protein